MSLTLFKRIDIDLNWYFTAISLGFTLHKRGFQVSLIFFDIDIYYLSPKWRARAAERTNAFIASMEKAEAEWGQA